MINKVLKFEKRSIVVTPDDLMTVSEFALKHGCSKEYVYKLHYKGLLEFYKRGKNKVSESEALKAMEL